MSYCWYGRGTVEEAESDRDTIIAVVAVWALCCALIVGLILLGAIHQ